MWCWCGVGECGGERERDVAREKIACVCVCVCERMSRCITPRSGEGAVHEGGTYMSVSSSHNSS